MTPTATIDPCNRASFISDVTIADQTILHISEAFTKTWRIQNVGTCTWTTAYKVVFIGGEKMSSPDSMSLPTNVLPGQTIDLSLNLVAPDIAGKYQGNWELEAPNGKVFGVGDSADQPFWVRIRVITPSINTATATPSATSLPSLTPTTTQSIAYDFVNNACAAQWQSNQGTLPCPGQAGDTRGFVLILNQAKLEDGTVANLPALLTFPQFANDGFVQGTYPEYQVKAGDHLQTTASCQNGATACSVLFQISYMDDTGAKKDLWTVGEFYDGRYSNVDLDLAGLAGKKVKFVLKVSALGSPVDDQALWIAPHIVNFPVPAATSTSAPLATQPSPMPAMTLTRTPTPAPTPTAITSPTPSAGGEKPVSAPSFQDILNQIISFFQKLFGR